jgi:hypothetical protein
LGLNEELSIAPMNALTGLPLGSNSIDPSSTSKAKVGFAGQQHQIFQLALGIALIVVAIDYLRKQHITHKDGLESAVVWALALVHILYITVRNKLLHLLITLVVVGASIVYWARHLIKTPTEAVFIRLLLLSVFRAVL